MVLTILRIFILYVLATAAVRIMGKRQIGELQPSELVITILLSEIAAIPMQDTDIPLLNSVVAVLLLVAFEIISSVISMKSRGARRLLEGNAVTVIRDGKIDQKEIKRLRYTVDDLLTALRQKDVFVLSDVTYAIVETNGTLSVVKKAAADYLRPSDMGVKAKDEGLEVVVVSDGDLSVGSMHLCGKNEEWIHSILKSEAVPLPEVFILTVNTAGHYTLIRRDGSLKKGVKK